MYVYRTSGFNDKAERYGIQSRIDDLCTELETQRIDEVQGRFERVYPYLKRRTLNRRIIARILRIDDEQVLCLLDIFKRGDNDYEEFLEAPIEYGKTYLEPQLDIAAIRNWLVEQILTSKLEQQLPELPETLRPWLEPPGWEIEMGREDWVIYESQEWVTHFRTSEIQNAWEIYYQIVSGIRNGTIEYSEIADLSNVKLSSLNNSYVLYSQLETSDSTVGGVLFLLAPFNHQPSSEEIIEIGKKTGLFDGAEMATEGDYGEETNVYFPEAISNQTYRNQNNYNILARQLSLSDLTPFARRSYPAYLLADEESWLAIERGKESNLALSAEEEQILQSVSLPQPGKGSLPLFINGRAGSGKSTMLLYLFADYCYRKYYDKQGHRRQEPLPGEALFLTYNERLLEVAKDGVKTLLSSHHRFVAERSKKDENEGIDRCFQSFQKFLFNLLPQQERDKFDPEKYISFHRFKQLYQGKSSSESLAKVVLQLPQARRYSPETCWHVIRSFIKGYGLQENMTPEDYKEEVPRKERTIDFEKFQGIYDTIWDRWYKRITQEQGYWDDQDLIAKVLELKCYCPSFAAIFCDEAQDFTKLELQLIMRLSMFSQYHLGYQPLQSLPFAFAGDPFQTLNPTGFHWSSVQAMFDSEVITALDPADQLKLVINFQDLTFNYRSTPPIVEFTNLIQLWRHVLFDIQEIQPQTAWQQGNFPEPQKFIFNQNIIAEQLQFYIKDTIIIVPCEEGEEVSYVRGDDVLSEIFPQIESSETAEQDQEINNLEIPAVSPRIQPIKNVLSAISTKGLEFKKVILYKFGEDCQRGIWNQQGKDTDQRVKVEYFFNKLYVAASRATEHLFVVDSELGDRQLWQHASNEALLQAMVMYSKNKERWENSVKTLSDGTPKTAQALREDDPGAIAQEFETKGLNSHNSGLLRRARLFYNDLGNVVKANFCEAWALKFEDEFLNAGKYFLGVGILDQAWECFWEGMCWSQLVSLYEQYPNIPNHREIEYSLAVFMIAQPRNIEAINNFTGFISSQFSELEGDSEQQLIHSKQGKKVIEEYANRIETLLNIPEIKRDEWQNFGEVLDNLGKAGYSELNLLAGECFYRAEKLSEAVRTWEACGVTQKLEYNKAKAMLLGFPESLEYLEKAGEHNTILAEWEKAGKPRDRQWIQFVAPSLELKQQYQQAFVVYIWLDQLAKVKECFEKASKGTPTIKLLSVLLQYLYRRKSFGEAIEAIEKYLDVAVGSESKKTDIKFNLIYQIACSDLVPESLTKEQRQGYEQFISQVLVSSEWQQHLLTKQLGIALEKIGSIIEVLKFYEQFVSDSDPELRDFARERWIAIKKKQENYSKKHKQSYKASKLHTEIFKKARSWSINEHSVSLEPPAAPRERLSSETFDPRATLTDYSRTDYSLPSTVSNSEIKGLPSDTKLEQLEGGVVKFVVRHLSIKLMKQSQQILITDMLNGKQVRVDGRQCKVNIGELAVEAAQANQLTFSLSTSGYSGSLVCTGKKPQLELDIQGFSEKIYLQL